VNQRKRNVTLVVICLMLATFAHAQAPAAQPSYSNPVIAGDYPDPSIIRTGDDYWATATGSEWAPVYPILHSHDLVNWKLVGSVFPDPPSWAEGSFWAPEISEYKGKFYVFYTARKRGGPLCVASASSDAPAGPYHDNGPLMCQEDGSIDAFPVIDENGVRYLIWKEDGNSRNQPTPLWAQPLSEDGTTLIGEPKEILRNERTSWEGGVVEGPFVLRRNGHFYIFYSGNACCGLKCNYALGVARSEKLLGPYEKSPRNPLVRSNSTWKCPGHGSVVTDQQGRTFLLYHAYGARDFIFVGREAVLDEISWGADNWPTINGNNGVSVRAISPLGAVQRADNNFLDHFESRELLPGWQWPQGHRPVITLTTENEGVISLAPGSGERNDRLAAVLARPTLAGNYVATTSILTGSLVAGAEAGLAAFGDLKNAMGVSIATDGITLWERRNGRTTTMSKLPAVNATQVQLRMAVKKGYELQFAFSADGKKWTPIGNKLQGVSLAPWDRSIRVAIFSGGAGQIPAKFGYVRIVTEP